MEISFTHRFIFVHVYRAGGQSVSAALRPYAYVPNRYIARVPVVRKLGKARIQGLRDHYYGHIKAKELEAALPAQIFDTFFKFTFVRNPWAWQVSIYHYVRQRADHPDHARYTEFASFSDYLDWRVHEAGVELQKEFVMSDSGRLLVDFVGHQETLVQDFATVSERVGIDASLPHKNRSAHGDFREYYTAETRALVAEAYKEDIELFGYDFDRPSALPPIPLQAGRA